MDDFYSNIDEEWELGSQDGEGDDGEDLPSGFSADHVLILLDCGIPMWKGVFPDPDFPEDELSPFDFVVKRLTTFLKAEIRQRATWKTGRRNGFGVYLFNTELREHVDWDSPLKRQSAATATDTKDNTQGATTAHGNEEGEPEEDEDPSFGVNRSSTVHELIPLEVPGIATIQTLKAIQEDGIMDREFDIQDAYCPQNETHDPEHTALQTAFSMAGQIVEDSKCVHSKPSEGKLPDRVRVWVITNQDMTGEFTVVAAQDLVDRNLEISLWPLPHAEKESFDYQNCFASMPFIQSQTDEMAKKDLLDWWKSTALTDQLDVWKTVRPIHSLPMLWPGEQDTDEEAAYLQLHWYRLVQTAARPMKIVVHQETGVRLNSMLQIVEKDSISQDILYEKVTGDKDTPPKISPRLCPYIEVQGTRVPMSAEDKIQLKAKSHPHKYASLRVIGFRPADSIDRTTCSIEKAYFCIPPDDSESRVRGSRTAFAALHSAMTSKKALLLGEVLTRKTATTRLVAAWPIPELTEPDEEGGDADVLVRSAGLLVIVLPFDNEIKKPISDVASEPTDALVEEAKAIVDGITISPVLGAHFPNMGLDLFWEKLEEVALNERNSEKNDENMLTKEYVVSKVGSHLDTFMMLLPDDPIPEKKKRVRESVPDDSGIDWVEAYAQDSLDSFKIDDLKKYLKSVGEKVSGRKQDLIDRMKPYLDKGVAVKTEP